MKEIPLYKAQLRVPAEIRPLLKVAHDQGFIFEHGKSHIKVVSPGGEKHPLPGRLRQGHGLENIKSGLANFGVDFDPPNKPKAPEVKVRKPTEARHAKSWFCQICGPDTRFETVGERDAHFRDEHGTPSGMWRLWIADLGGGVSFNREECFEGGKQYAPDALIAQDAFNIGNCGQMLSNMVKQGEIIRVKRGVYATLAPGEHPGTEPLDADAEVGSLLSLVPPAPSDIGHRPDWYPEAKAAFDKLRANETMDPRYWEAVAAYAIAVYDIQAAAQA